jgi:hypothetical protein
MKRFTVTAKVKFQVDDTNEFTAKRQATAAILKYILNDPAHADYNEEYPTLPQPYFLAGDTEIQDEDGKVLIEFFVDTEDEEDTKEDSAKN